MPAYQRHHPKQHKHAQSVTVATVTDEQKKQKITSSPRGLRKTLTFLLLCRQLGARPADPNIAQRRGSSTRYNKSGSLRRHRRSNTRARRNRDTPLLNHTGRRVKVFGSQRGRLFRHRRGCKGGRFFSRSAADSSEAIPVYTRECVVGCGGAPGYQCGRGHRRGGLKGPSALYISNLLRKLKFSFYVSRAARNCLE